MVKYSIYTICKHTNSGKCLDTYFSYQICTGARKSMWTTIWQTLCCQMQDSNSQSLSPWHHHQQLASPSVNATHQKEITKIPIQLPDSIDRNQVCEILIGLWYWRIHFCSYQIYIGAGKHIKPTVLPTCLCSQTQQLNSQYSVFDTTDSTWVASVLMEGTAEDRTTILQHNWYTSSYI